MQPEIKKKPEKERVKKPEKKRVKVRIGKSSCTVCTDWRNRREGITSKVYPFPPPFSFHKKRGE